MAKAPTHVVKQPEVTAEERHLNLLRQLKELQSQIDADTEGKNAAINALLEKRRAIDADLAALGYAAPAQFHAAPSRQRVVSPPREKNPDTPCKVCGYVTVPAHDARAHRHQQPKAPFTDADLQARRMVRKTPVVA